MYPAWSVARKARARSYAAQRASVSFAEVCVTNGKPATIRNSFNAQRSCCAPFDPHQARRDSRAQQRKPPIGKLLAVSGAAHSFRSSYKLLDPRPDFRF